MADLFREFPQTMEDAVNKLVSNFTFREKSRIANMPEKKLNECALSLGKYIRSELRLDNNQELMAACRLASGKKDISVTEASLFILRAFWKKLQDEKILKLVK